jgi:hypothetical protein
MNMEKHLRSLGVGGIVPVIGLLILLTKNAGLAMRVGMTLAIETSYKP